MSAFGRVDLYCEPGQDLVVTGNVDLQTVNDLQDDGLATQQWLERYLLTRPILKDDLGNIVARADDPFNPLWGLGLSRLVGSMDRGNLVTTTTAAIRDALTQCPYIAEILDIFVGDVQENQGILPIFIDCVDIAGKSLTIPIQNIKIF